MDVSLIGKARLGFFTMVIAVALSPLAYAQSSNAFALVPNVTDTGRYGYQYGSSSYRDEVVFFISDCSGTAKLSVSGFDVDRSDEVQVFINGSSAGYLSKGRGNNRLNSGNVFNFLSASSVTDEIIFRQQRSGEKWGVTNLLVSGCEAANGGGSGGGSGGDDGTNPGEPTPTLVNLTESLDTTRYGHNYGTNQNETEALFAFDNIGAAQTLSLNGYDINNDTEIAVLLNNSAIGYLSRGRKRKLNSGDEFVLALEDQVAGQNLVTFRQTRAGNSWGVTNLLLVSDDPPDNGGGTGGNGSAPLTFGVADTNQYGYQFGNVDNTDSASFTFSQSSNDIYISVHGFDIDTKKEVQLELNGKVIGHLTKGANLSDNGGDVFVLPALDQISGTNSLAFTQTKNGGEQWGITKLQLIGCQYQVNGTAAPANSGTPVVIDDTTGTVIFANFFNSGAIEDGTDRYVSVCVSEEDDEGDRFAHFTTDVGLDDNIQIKAYPEFIIGSKFGLTGETSFRPFPELLSSESFEYPALDVVASLVGVPAFTNTLPDIDIVVDIDEQNVAGSIRDVMLESWFYDTSANSGRIGNHSSDIADWTAFQPLPPINSESLPKAGDTLSGTLNNIVGPGHTNSDMRNVLLEMMVHIGPLSPNDISYDPNNPNPDRNPARFRLTQTPITIGDYQYHIWYGSTYISPLVVFSRETNALGERLINLTEEGEINLDWNEFLQYSLYELEPQLANAGVSWAMGNESVFPRMRAATGAIGGIEFGIEPQTNGTFDQPYRATVRKFEVYIRGSNFGL